MLTNVDLQSARHATQQHVQDADVGGAAVEQGDAIEEEGECQAEFGVVPYGGAAVPARVSVRKCPANAQNTWMGRVTLHDEARFEEYAPSAPPT